MQSLLHKVNQLVHKHGKTICDAFQKRNVFFSTKNEM